MMVLEIWVECIRSEIASIQLNRIFYKILNEIFKNKVKNAIIKGTRIIL